MRGCRHSQCRSGRIRSVFLLVALAGHVCFGDKHPRQGGSDRFPASPSPPTSSSSSSASLLSTPSVSSTAKQGAPREALQEALAGSVSLRPPAASEAKGGGKEEEEEALSARRSLQGLPAASASDDSDISSEMQGARRQQQQQQQQQPDQKATATAAAAAATSAADAAEVAAGPSPTPSLRAPSPGGQESKLKQIEAETDREFDGHDPKAHDHSRDHRKGHHSHFDAMPEEVAAPVDADDVPRAVGASGQSPSSKGSRSSSSSKKEQKDGSSSSSNSDRTERSEKDDKGDEGSSRDEEEEEEEKSGYLGSEPHIKELMHSGHHKEHGWWRLAKFMLVFVGAMIVVIAGAAGMGALLKLSARVLLSKDLKDHSARHMLLDKEMGPTEPAESGPSFRSPPSSPESSDSSGSIAAAASASSVAAASAAASAAGTAPATTAVLATAARAAPIRGQSALAMPRATASEALPTALRQQPVSSAGGALRLPAGASGLHFRGDLSEVDHALGRTGSAASHPASSGSPPQQPQQGHHFHQHQQHQQHHHGVAAGRTHHSQALNNQRHQQTVGPEVVGASVF